MSGTQHSQVSRLQRIDLILECELAFFQALELQRIDRLHGSHQMRTFLEVEIPQITIPVAPGRNLAVLVEAAVRDHLLKLNGYNAALDFIERQRRQIQSAEGDEPRDLYVVEAGPLDPQILSRMER